MTLKFTITADTATPALKQALALLEDQGPILGAMGRRLIRDTSQHVMEWGLSHPNKLGGKRTNYWSGIAARINPGDCLSVSGNTATVSLGGPTMPGLMRAMGPITIVPGTKTPGVKYLALPARAESYGLRPREFGALTIFWRGKGQLGGLAQPVPVTRTKNTKRGAKGSQYFRPGMVYYWFATSVTQPQDRSLLPSDDKWSASVNAGAKEWVDLELKKI